MPQQCSNCGLPVQAGHRFCSNCGYAQVSAPTLPIASVELAAATTEKPSVRDSAIDSTAPVTYVVQRYDTAPPSVETTPPISSSLPTRIAGSEQQPEPYPAFVPPALPSLDTGTPEVATPRGAIPPPPARSLDIAQVGTGSSTYGNFSHSGPTLRGGAFAAFEGGAVKQLERQSPQRAWLMPVLIAGVVALFLLAAGGAYLLLSKQPAASTQQPSANSQQLSGDDLAREEENLRETVRVSNDEQIKAWRDLDTEVLKGTRVGSVLRENIDMVEMLRQNNTYAIPVLQRLDFLEVKVDGDTATVRTIETWTVTFYNKDTKEEVRKNGPDTFRETYHMVKQDGKWMVDKLEIDDTTSAPGSTS